MFDDYERARHSVTKLHVHLICKLPIGSAAI